ncbi:sulfatase-like hydrolase/transferase [Coraliomargarita sp. SDUM461004]|uniref:Sulfatase-like hydrolase/transferase n=1 Tax=Thalassobacterium sedimentorum TaxID=3041258 RepID=A0ABU1AG11_9BACT|nr:sulfatase-like hydrolase/transferase [Coraliomargarita sp. SDUM461004]MDQ8193612.1 sulfatase-like hydrolase/transferase [Coraliomargarita sp. SDUM461004]
MSQPNILIIICDQLSAQALPAWGNTYANTPNINSIIDSGVRCESAYSNCPLCLPSRASFWSGRYPHQTGILSNGREHTNAEFPENAPTLGSLFKEAGYTTVHFGKQHDGGSLRGFDCAPTEEILSTPAHPSLVQNYDTWQDNYTSQRAVDFLNSYKQDAPYCMVADFNNPHNICGWIGNNANATPLEAEFDNLPPLPENLYLSDEELRSRPLPIQHLPNAHVRQAQIAGWDEKKIQHYLHAYHHYLNLADQEIGKLLQTLKSRADAEETLVAFFSDHGDSMTGRWMATKHTSFYEETTHVPLAFSGFGVARQGQTLNGLCSLIDLLPTLCDFAGIQVPSETQGKSLYPALSQGNNNIDLNDAVFSQWYTEWGYTIEPGRMVRTEQFKYTHYLEDGQEELYDLQTDPGEMHNLANSDDMLEDLQRHRDLLEQHLRTSHDPYRSLKPKAAPIFRQTATSYQHFSGPVAPEFYTIKNNISENEEKQ